MVIGWNGKNGFKGVFCKPEGVLRNIYRIWMRNEKMVLGIIGCIEILYTKLLGKKCCNYLQTML